MVFLLRRATQTLLLCGLATAAPAEPPTQSLEAMTQAAVRHLEAEIQRQYPELKAKVSVRQPDPRLRFPACRQLQFALAPGSDLQGGGSLGVRCEVPPAWSLYLGYRIDLRGPVLVTTRPIPARDTLKARDVENREVELAAAPGQYLRQPQQAVGMLAKQPLKAGQPLTFAMLAKPLAIRAGQKVRIVVQHPDFSISQECTALANANVGDLVRCKVPSGRIVQGTASETGVLQIKP
jgi:flagella basal body P-ring formation protein FlgA